MRNPFSNIHCKTDLEILNILRKAHLSLIEIDPSCMPQDVYDAKQEYEKVLLENIWRISKNMKR